ncbi:MAG: HAD family phosphatase [Gemmatimonadetes bacterium]|nr:HAD family phosphatase [Gemmatimonadota bacterium]
MNQPHKTQTLYVTDLDGTLLQDDATLSGRSRDILLELLADGLPLTVATARSVASFRPILQELPLKLPVIEFNGAFLSDFSTGKHHFVRALKPHLVADILELIRAQGVQPYLATYGERDNLFCPPSQNAGMEWFVKERQESDDPRLRLVDDVQCGVAEQVVCVTLIGDEAMTHRVHAELSSRWGAMLQLYHWPHDSSPAHWLTIQDVKVTKARAVDELVHRIGTKDCEVTAFGDQINDIEMLSSADRGIAVANATAELRVLATQVIGSNTEDSVAQFLRRDWAHTAR